MSKRYEPIEFHKEIHQESIRKVKDFLYLGSVLISDARCTKEIKGRVGNGKKAFRKIKNVLISSFLCKEKIKRAVKNYVYSTLL